MKLTILSIIVFLSLSLKPAPTPSLTIEVYVDETGKTILKKSYDNRIWDECSILKEVGQALVEDCKTQEQIKKL